MERRHQALHPLIASSAPRRGAHAHPRRRRVLAWIFSWRLDEALAEGADPERDQLIACRAARLVEPATRRELAEGLRDTVEAAMLTRPRGAAVPVAAQVARAQLLLTDGGSPLYRPATPPRLQNAVETALIGLEV